jgi:hypothetical protein
VRPALHLRSVILMAAIAWTAQAVTRLAVVEKRGKQMWPATAGLTFLTFSWKCGNLLPMEGSLGAPENRIRLRDSGI